jgi:hypothetical protein
MIKARLEAIKIIKGDLDNSLDMLIDDLKNTELDLDERWSAYVDLVNGGILTGTQLYGDGHIDILGDFTLYDHFYVERRETVTFVSILERLEEMIEDDDEDVTTPENIIEWKEKVLSFCFASFQYDW